MPNIEQITNEVPDKIIVALNLSNISSITGLFRENDLPKSPWSILYSQMKYLCQIGLSRPSWEFRILTFSGVAKEPNIAVAGSPGIKEIMK